MSSAEDRRGQLEAAELGEPWQPAEPEPKGEPERERVKQIHRGYDLEVICLAPGAWRGSFIAPSGRIYIDRTMYDSAEPALQLLRALVDVDLDDSDMD